MLKKLNKKIFLKLMKFFVCIRKAKKTCTFLYIVKKDLNIQSKVLLDFVLKKETI